MFIQIISMILSIFSSILGFFSSNGIIFYLYYDIFLFAGLLLSIAVSYKSIVEMARRVSKREYIPMLAAVLVFIAIALIFVTPTFMIYNDEYIYGAIAKSMIYNHLAGICSFSSGNYCVPGTEGLFHQPTGWSFIEAIAFLITGVKIPTMFGLQLIISTLAVILIFYVAYDMFEDYRIAALSSFILAMTPVFMRYARSAVPDMSTAMFGLLSILLLMEYMRSKRFVVGVAAVFAAVYTMATKVDGVIIIPILMSVLLTYKYNFSGRKAKSQLYSLLVLVILLFVVGFPQIMFLLIANQHGFGVNPGLPKFSYSDFTYNLPQNVLFWFGAYTYVVFPFKGVNYIYNVEFPITYTLFAILGAILLFAKKNYRNLALLVLWFLAIFLFYTSYYAGGALYSNGDDIRYFLLAFAPISILASFSTFYIYDAYQKKAQLMHLSQQMRKHTSIIVLTILLVIMLSVGMYQIFTIVAQNPSQYFAFAGERASWQLIESYYHNIPADSMVVSLKPPLWYLLGRPTIYASWITLPQYEQEFENLSANGVYFDYGISCAEGARAYYQSTAAICADFMAEHKTEPLIILPFDKDSWDTVIGIYKVLGPANASNSSG